LEAEGLALAQAQGERHYPPRLMALLTSSLEDLLDLNE
jgi:hypothetical protein